MATKKSDSQLLQDFVKSLLNDPGIEFDAPNVEHSEISAELIEPILVLAGDSLNGAHSKNGTSAKLAKTEINITAVSEKPLFSEKIKRAQNLLKAMPDIADVIQHPEVSDLPTVLLRNDLISEVLLENPDDIIITEDITEDIDQELDDLHQETQLEINTHPNEVGEAVEASFDQTVEIQQEIIPSPLQDGIPEWGRGRFQTLIFNVGELKLAVPLIKLGGIHKIDPKPTPMPEKPDWYLGLVADSVGNISLIDTALWIMPEKYQMAKAKGLDYELIVLLDDSRWGLACSGVENAITLSEDDVRWNHTKSKRPWLAGMLVDEMCALIDVDTLLLMINSLTFKHPSNSEC